MAGYLLFSMGKLPNGPVYQLFNLVGGLAVAINVAAHHAVPSTIVNGIWAIVAFVVLVKMGRARRAARRGAPATEQAALRTEPPATTAALRTEPPATTAVLPIVGPALRDHEAEATVKTEAEPRLQSVAADRATIAADATTVGHATTTPAAPMTASVPVITATIALALVAAAQEHADRQPADRYPAAQQPAPAASTPA